MSLLAACGVGDAKADVRTAQELADRLFPGQLTVIGSRSLFPQDTGSEVTFAVRGDPDAIVRLAVRSDKTDIDQKMRDAVDLGRAQAAELRTALKVFRDCGHEIVGIGEIPFVNTSFNLTVWIASPITNTTVTRLIGSLDDCVVKWRDARSNSESPWRSKVGNITLNILSAQQPPTLPITTGPTYQKLTDRSLAEVLAGSPHHSGLITPGRSLGDVLAPAMSFDEGQKFGAAMETAARDWLAAAILTPKPRLGRYLSTGNRLLPGTADKMRTYVTVCFSPSEKLPCPDEGAIALTVDLATKMTTDFTLVRTIRDKDGKYTYPIER
ncbi:hypothetical protein [Actinocrispum sp. NPDC049592]|uniref:hypothetical protein n=1 Tax=Actinocrispum sp. NPDC049592 TaxID=3154835 RepID=UPI00343582C6